LKNDLGDNFKQFVEFRDATIDLLEPYKEKFDFKELGKLAIDYSDGIIEAGKEVNADLLKHAQEKNLPIMNYPGEDNFDSYKEFINQICPNE
jgi:starch synthase